MTYMSYIVSNMVDSYLIFLFSFDFFSFFLYFFTKRCSRHVHMQYAPVSLHWKPILTIIKITIFTLKNKLREDETPREDNFFINMQQYLHFFFNLIKTISLLLILFRVPNECTKRSGGGAWF